jgi:hypothetical protein
VKQNANERVNKILLELKSNIDPVQIEIPDGVLPVAMAEQWTSLNQEVRDTVINHVRLHVASRSCEQYNAIILTAGFKPSNKAKIMGANLTGLADTKNLVLKTETLEGEKKAKTNGNGSNF